MGANREDIEKDFTFIGFLIMENRLKLITTPMIDMLQSAEIRTIMVTGKNIKIFFFTLLKGDNALTAISVARQCHIVDPTKRIFLGDLNEKEAEGRNVIVWKDFEYSERRLNNDLEPYMRIERKSSLRISRNSSRVSVGSRNSKLNKSSNIKEKKLGLLCFYRGTSKHFHYQVTSKGEIFSK